MNGAGEGAVYTVTLVPPPCGTRAILSTLTPMVAQSSEDASLITIGTLAVVPWDPDVELNRLEEPEEPPPQAVSVATMAPQTAKLSFLVSICLPRSERTVSAALGVSSG